MDAFFTREASNEGVKLPLNLPSGKKTDEFLILYGIDSDVYLTAVEESNRALFNRIVQFKKDHQGEEPNEEEQRKISLEVAKENHVFKIASLVKGWSFDEPCTQENVRKLLTEAPYLVEAIEIACGTRQNFFSLRSNASSNTQEKSSS